MSASKLISKLFPIDELMATIRRFPLSVICALALFVIGIAITHDFFDDKPEWLGRLSTILGCCYFWFGISKLISESQGLNIFKYMLLSFIGAGAISALFAFTNFWGINLFFVIPALLLCLMVAPYLRKGSDISVWFFNRHMWMGVFISYAALIMFAGGLSVALMAIETLFDVKIDHKIYADIWLFASLVLGPVYVLSWVPKQFEFSDDDCADPPGLKFIANWISAPMIFIYLLILYAYFVKIIVTGEVPNGHLSYLISGFVGAGIVTYLVAYPLRDVGSLQLKLFYKIFFPALIIPVGFHFYAIWERVSAYGFTEQRYMLLLSSLWFAIIALGGISRKMPIRFIPMSLAILMVLASFGPWSGVSVSGNSQFSRLEKLLLKNNLIAGSKVVKAKTDLSFDDRKNISSILDYLCRYDRDKMIEPWFNVDNKGKWKCSGGSYLTKEYLGFDYVSGYKTRNNDGNFYLSANKYEYIDISDYDIFIRNICANSHKGRAWKCEWSLENGSNINMSLSKGLLQINIDEYEAIKINLNEFAVGKVNLENNKLELIIEAENKDLSYRLIFNSLAGEIKDDKPEVNRFRCDLFYRITR